MCTIKDTKILLSDNQTISILDIIESNSIDHALIENGNDVGWYTIAPIEVQIKDKLELCTKVYYNGHGLTNKITFDDGFTVILTGTHRLLAADDIYITVDDLIGQFGVKVVVDGVRTITNPFGFKTIDGSIKKIINIEKNGAMYTWDIHVKNAHRYTLENGLISHNFGDNNYVSCVL